MWRGQWWEEFTAHLIRSRWAVEGGGRFLFIFAKIPLDTMLGRLDSSVSVRCGLTGCWLSSDTEGESSGDIHTSL